MDFVSLLTPLLGCHARTPLDWMHAWAMLGEWACKVAFPVPAQGIGWPRHGHGQYLRPNFSSECRLSSHGPDRFLSKEHSSLCQFSRRTSQSSVYQVTNCFRVKKSQTAIVTNCACLPRIHRVSLQKGIPERLRSTESLRDYGPTLSSTRQGI